MLQDSYDRLCISKNTRWSTLDRQTHINRQKQLEHPASQFSVKALLIRYNFNIGNGERDDARCPNSFVHGCSVCAVCEVIWNNLDNNEQLFTEVKVNRPGYIYI